MTRWDLKKTFTRASLDEFTLAVKTLQDELNGAAPVALQVTFYNGLPSATTMHEEWLAAANEADRQSKVMAVVSDLQDVTRDLWDKAVYVEARLKNDKTFANVEAKGLLPRSLTFYMQSNDPSVDTQHSQESVQKQFRGWRRGDGFFSYHYNVSLG